MAGSLAGGLLAGSLDLSFVMSITTSELVGTGEETLKNASNGFSTDGASGGESGEERCQT